MKGINIQLQPERSSNLEVENVLSVLEIEKLSPKISEGNDNGQYINIDFRVHSVYEVWNRLKPQLFLCPGVKESSIVVCEGSQSWDNYLLLHHYDSSQETDDVPSNH
ncbi:hypothetical protein [Microbulbifer sp. SAOS-129_SWC]|uniref:hypothetical protein n=1 Tax=Microbulbifer sp. SAOS-129_SWC TaxID=3145235 RepID=UPI003217BA40